MARILASGKATRTFFAILQCSFLLLILQSRDSVASWDDDSKSSDYFHALGIQGGWWVLELEYMSFFGLFVDVGIPWNPPFISLTSSTSPIEAKLGYQYSIGDGFYLRHGLRWAYFGYGNKFFVYEGEEHVDILSLEFGIRYEYGNGLAIGFDIPVFSLVHREYTLFFPEDFGMLFILSNVYLSYSIVF